MKSLKNCNVKKDVVYNINFNISSNIFSNITFGGDSFNKTLIIIMLFVVVIIAVSTIAHNSPELLNSFITSIALWIPDVIGR